jgi:ABC-2 type transport system permease protein
VKGEFVNTIDTVGLDPSVKKTILLTSSGYARTLSPPLLILVVMQKRFMMRANSISQIFLLLFLLEGIFSSAYKNRMPGALFGNTSVEIRNESMPTKMIVIADANIIRNEVQRSGYSEIPLPLGQDKYTGQIYGNRDFMLNCLNYLVDDNDLMNLRSREMKLRLLDRSKIREKKIQIQVFNIITPVLLVILAGIAGAYIRRRLYTGS